MDSPDLSESAFQRAWNDANQASGRAAGAVVVAACTGIGTAVFNRHHWLDATGEFVIGALVGFATGLALLIAIALLRALMLQRNEARRYAQKLESAEPQLQVGQPLCRALPIEWNEGRPARLAAFVYVPIRNEPEVGAEGGTAAEEVHARIRVLPIKGDRGTDWLPARWWSLSPQGGRWSEDWTPEDEFAEMRLPANGRDFYLDVVAQFPEQESCTISNQEAHVEIGFAFPFVVELMLQGSNISAKKFQVRITPAEVHRDGVGIPRAELVTR